MPYVVVTEIALRPEAADTAIAAARAIVLLARDGGDCDMIGLHRLAGASGILVYQRWRDRAAYDAFYAEPEVALELARVAAAASAPPRLTELDDVL